MRISKQIVLSLYRGNGGGRTQADDLRSMDWSGADPRRAVAKVVAMVPEGRGIFPSLTVREIMRIAMWATDLPKQERKYRLGWVLGILPAIGEFPDRRAGTVSGGQQQMVSIGRALLGRLRILLLDEPSIGVAPKCSRISCNRSAGCSKRRGC